MATKNFLIIPMLLSPAPLFQAIVSCCEAAKAEKKKKQTNSGTIKALNSM
jgi:hypothetical protein